MFELFTLIRNLLSNDAEGIRRDGDYVYIAKTALHGFFADAEELLELLLPLTTSSRARFSGSNSLAALKFDFVQLEQKAIKEKNAQAELFVAQQRLKEANRAVKLRTQEQAEEMLVAQVLNAVEKRIGDFRFGTNRADVARARQQVAQKSFAGTPCLLLSDWHWGEVVDPMQIEGDNEFNLDVAVRRANRVLTSSMELLTRANNRYDHMVVALGGDMLAGDIHEELTRTAELQLPDAIISLSEKLTEMLLAYADTFGHVYVPCVVGNHGRLDKKPTAKMKVERNWDYLVYRMTERMVNLALKQRRDSASVDFDIPMSADCRFDVQGTKFRLTHGDQFKVSGGIGGIFPGLLKTDLRKQQRAIKYGKEAHNVLLMGHWHCYGTQDGIIVNGSLKGEDEYTYNMNLAPQEPIQAMWIVHPSYGITHHLPVFADEAKRDENVEHPPIRRYQTKAGG